MTIAILCQTRGRPELCARMIKSALATAEDATGFEVLLYVDNDDPRLNDYAVLAAGCPNVRLVTGPSLDAAWRWNTLARKATRGSTHPLLMMAGDDMVFQTQRWDAAFETARTNFPKGLGLLSFDDGRGPKGKSHPHPVMTREMYEILGYFSPPMFQHWYIDTWLVEVAKRAGCFAYLHDVVVGHVKPADSGVLDDTHLRIRSAGRHDRDTLMWEISQPYLNLDVQRMKGAL